MIDLEKRLDAVCESMANTEKMFNEACLSLADSLNVIHERLEHVEKWIMSAVKEPAKE